MTELLPANFYELSPRAQFSEIEFVYSCFGIEVQRPQAVQEEQGVLPKTGDQEELKDVSSESEDDSSEDVVQEFQDEQDALEEVKAFQVKEILNQIEPNEITLPISLSNFTNLLPNFAEHSPKT